MIASKLYLPFKFTELVISIIMIGLTHKSHDQYYIDYYLMTTGTFVAYTIIACEGLIGILLDTPLGVKLDMVLCFVGFVVYIGGSITVLAEFVQVSDPIGITAGVFAILTAIVLLVDAILLLRKKT